MPKSDNAAKVHKKNPTKVKFSKESERKKTRNTGTSTSDKLIALDKEDDEEVPVEISNLKDSLSLSSLRVPALQKPRHLLNQERVAKLEESQKLTEALRYSDRSAVGCIPTPQKGKRAFDIVCPKEEGDKDNSTDTVLKPYQHKSLQNFSQTLSKRELADRGHKRIAPLDRRTVVLDRCHNSKIESDFNGKYSRANRYQEKLINDPQLQHLVLICFIVEIKYMVMSLK